MLFRMLAGTNTPRQRFFVWVCAVDHSGRQDAVHRKITDFNSALHHS
jgi:hypothetical protein